MNARYRARRMKMDTLKRLVAELNQNAKESQYELSGWDHKREYRRLRDLAMQALKEIKAAAKAKP